MSGVNVIEGRGARRARPAAGWVPGANAHGREPWGLRGEEALPSYFQPNWAFETTHLALISACSCSTVVG